MRFQFHPEALDEYEAAGRCYAKQQPDLDVRFIEHVEDAVQLILEDPFRWLPFDGTCAAVFPRVFLYGSLHNRA